MTVRMLDQFSQAPDLTVRLDSVQDFFVQFGHECMYQKQAFLHFIWSSSDLLKL